MLWKKQNREQYVGNERIECVVPKAHKMWKTDNYNYGEGSDHKPHKVGRDLYIHTNLARAAITSICKETRGRPAETVHKTFFHLETWMMSWHCILMVPLEVLGSCLLGRRQVGSPQPYKARSHLGTYSCLAWTLVYYQVFMMHGYMLMN